MLKKLLLVMVIFVLGVNVFAQETKASELYTKGMEYVKKAESSESSLDKTDNYEKAIAEFNDVIKNKKTKDSPEAIFSQYEIAVIKANAEGKLKNTQQAYEGLKLVVARWDRTDAELDKAGFTSKEIAEIKTKLVEIKATKKAVGEQLDKENSKKIQYKIIDFLVKATGSIPSFSYWFAIVLLASFIKIILTPLSNAQMKSMKEMQVIQPKIKEIQEKYKGDQKLLGEKTMELYKEHKINPLAGCLPLLIQMPVLFFLFYVIKSYEIQFQNGTFLWIGNLGHQFSLNVMGQPGQMVWFSANNLAEADLLLLVIYIASTFISMKFNTPSADKQQAEQQKMMSIMFPLMFAFLFAGFPSAFLLYWLVFNIFQTVQQKMYMNKTAVTTEVVAPAKNKTKKK